MAPCALATFFAFGILTSDLPSQTPSSPPPAVELQSSFGSINDFVAAIKAIVPEKSTDYLAWQFAAPDLGQIGDPERGRVLRASSIGECTVLWSDDDAALVFATARPPTETTNCQVGVLFYLRQGEQNDKKWCIVDMKKVTAYGKNSSVEARLTCDAEGGGYTLEPGFVVVTLTENGGGQHISSSVSASFRISDVAFVPAGLD